MKIIIIAALLALTLYASALTNSPNCAGGNCAGYASYSKSFTNGWGYIPVTNGNTTFSAAYTNQANVNVQANGKQGQNLCSHSNSVVIPNPPIDSAYRFIVYFPVGSVLPTNVMQCPLLLTNILP